jgi:hypothetical protein
MSEGNTTMKRLPWILCVVQIVLGLVAFDAIAAGISVDAGLTPAEDRWIVRTQLRYMERHDDPTTMGRRAERYLFNAVVAYGLRRNLTLIIKQPAVHQERSMAGTTDRDTGFADLSILAKYKVYRHNTRVYTFGAAATLGLELPTGADAFTSETWDLKPGLYLSWRRGRWASDFNIDYAWNGFSDDGVGDVDPGDELSMDWALAHQFSIGREADITLAPVLEISYKNITRDRLDNRTVKNTGETILYFSPGLKFTKSSLILEALAQIPVWQDQEGSQLERSTTILAGMRFMF